ncbi:hypothetical protein PVAG01_03041 [Phlyctema vagabunda]|uniref:EVE domain-containing protein n=1 Tax=Phlyctema vagabunda TaxID=108571 RepID=A0ABR4PS95_9HELO
MPKKRKAQDSEAARTEEAPRRSSRRKPAQDEAGGDTRTSTPAPRATKMAKQESRRSKEISPEANDHQETPPKLTSNVSRSPPNAEPDTIPSHSSTGRRQYWLLKAEPESRLEKGHDIKFSIDDLASKKEPEPWDGIRAYPARNNLRAMKKGDLAFFYHSSCKVPAIVGIMEIVQEHSPDLTAHDPKAPYYDAKSDPEDPKWSVVHVEFRQKLKTPVTLKDLRGFQNEKGNPLANMQMLKLTRLSVSKVSAEEWDFLVGVMKENGDEIVGT